jgi:hypothetical protein
LLLLGGGGFCGAAAGVRAGRLLLLRRLLGLLIGLLLAEAGDGEGEDGEGDGEKWRAVCERGASCRFHGIYISRERVKCKHPSAAKAANCDFGESARLKPCPDENLLAIVFRGDGKCERPIPRPRRTTEGADEARRCPRKRETKGTQSRIPGLMGAVLCSYAGTGRNACATEDVWRAGRRRRYRRLLSP